MKVCITGWYGTETLGDRAILLGILRCFVQLDDKLEVFLGSLYPFFSERTLLEDGEALRDISSDMKITIFESKDRTALENAVRASDYVVMGGGPLMDIMDMEIVNYAFSYARKRGVKTCLMGCGIGPLHKAAYIKMLHNILKNTDLGIFRDSNSYEYAVAHHCKNAFWTMDPAVIALEGYLNTKHQTAGRDENKIVVNFREFPKVYSGNVEAMDRIKEFLNSVLAAYEMVELIPMHTFSVGGDDRLYLEKLRRAVGSDRMLVAHEPMGTLELFEKFHTAQACTGMRYHSVVFQTLINGNNLIFDYTDKKNGKIQSFLADVDKDGFYHRRVVRVADIFNVDYDWTELVRCLKEGQRFEWQPELIAETKEMFVKEIRELGNH